MENISIYEHKKVDQNSCELLSQTLSVLDPDLYQFQGRVGSMDLFITVNSVTLKKFIGSKYSVLKNLFHRNFVLPSANIFTIFFL